MAMSTPFSPKGEGAPHHCGVLKTKNFAEFTYLTLSR